MKTDELMTMAAVALAVFAVYKLTGKPGGGELASNAAQADRDAKLGQWNSTLAAQWAAFGAARPESSFQLDSLLFGGKNYKAAP